MNESTITGAGLGSHLPGIRFGLTLVAGLSLIMLFFWQVFMTLPHLVRFYRDTGGYLEAGPFRGPGLYSFIQSALWIWNDFYAAAIAQDVLLAFNAALLAYAVWRVTRSPLLALIPLLLCLFKASILENAQGLSTDALFPIVCIGLMACALLLYEKASALRIISFLLFAFFACFLRSIGEPIIWSLVLVLALRLWSERRRAVVVLAAGCLGIHVLLTGISHLMYGTWVPQAQAGFVLIIGAAVVADEDVPRHADDGYPREFVAATASIRTEYKKAATWQEKYEVIDRNIGPIQSAAIETLIRSGSYAFDRSRYDKFKDYGHRVAWEVMLNDVLQQAALNVISRNRVEYAKMALVNLTAGAHIFPGFADYPLESAYGQAWADHTGRIADEYISISTRPEFIPLIHKLTDDWHNTPFELKYDIARPARAFFRLGDALDIKFMRSGLRDAAGSGGTLSWLFIIESVLVLLLVGRRLLRWQPIEGVLGVLLVLIVPTWGYLFVLSLLVIPMPIYMEATSSFVYLALLIGAWTMVTAAINRFWHAARPELLLYKSVAHESITPVQ